MKKIIVLADKGMLGHIVQRYLENTGKYEVIGANSKDFDAKELITVIKLMQKTIPDYVINCVGILNHSNDLQLYADVNILFPRFLAQFCKDINSKLITISTNCVFKDIGPHSANNAPTATDLYGMSKAFGEINDGHNLTIRTSIIGPELKKDGIGLFNQVMQGKIKNGYQNIFWNGVTTLELAKQIEKNLDEIGIIQITGNIISKLDICKNINGIFDMDIEFKKVIGNTHQSLLIGEKVDDSISYQLLELEIWMTKNKDLYEGVYDIK